MLRVVVGLALSVVLASAIAASASELVVSSETAQSGGDTTLQCDLDGVNVSYSIAWSNALDGFIVTHVIVSEIEQPQCTHHQIKIRLHFSSPYGDMESDVQVNGSSVVDWTLPPAQPRPVENLVGIDIAVHTGPT